MTKSSAQKRKSFLRHPSVWGGGALLVALVVVGFFAGPKLFSSTYEYASSTGATASREQDPTRTPPTVVHLPTPEPLKAIYMTQCVVATPGFRQKLVDLIDATELNAVVIDIKDYSGRLAFPSDDPEFASAVSPSCSADDLPAFVALLHTKHIYVIGRITVFQDPYYTRTHPELAVKKESDGSVWKDHKGLSFIDVGARPYWQYIVDIGRASYNLGFDELNFDYVRYPSDGNMKDIAFSLSGTLSKAQALENFFSFLYDSFAHGESFGGLRPEHPTEAANRPVLSVDLFGYTTTNTDDLGIGQVIERALPYFDYVMPMVYPSHYNSGFIGIAKPATEPYKVVNYSMSSAVRRARLLGAAGASSATSTDMLFLRDESRKGHGDIVASQLRPWLQDFDLGATYTADMVRAQMQATYDAGLTSWALWDAGNTYTASALLPQ
jgi:hypothetical protein